MFQNFHTDLSIDKNVEMIAKWLTECWHNHPNCNVPELAPLPTRVIDVGLDLSSPVKLYVSDGCKDYYAALSYCWGDKQEYITTTQTIKSRKENMFLEDLPQTLQDAIMVTRRLGIRYLWVDALCIIQDNAEDKAIQINAMGDVYKNAVLTIAASSAVSVSDGFLRSIPPTQGFWVPNIENTKVMVRSLNTYSHASEIDSLDSRGWALQESLLSPRVVSFAERELSWRCQTVAIEKQRRGHKICKRLPSGVFGIALEDRSTFETKQDLVWEAIVEDYSGRELTVPEDRLPAIAGIVSELARLWGDTYLAGL